MAEPEELGLKRCAARDTYLDDYERAWIGPTWDVAEDRSGRFHLYCKGNWRLVVGTLDLACAVVADNEGAGRAVAGGYTYGVTPVEVAEGRSDYGDTIPDNEVSVRPSEAAAQQWVLDWESGGNGDGIWVIVRKPVVRWETYRR